MACIDDDQPANDIWEMPEFNNNTKRVIIEFCADPSSRIGILTPKDCNVFRITAQHDITSEENIQKVINIVDNIPQGIDILLWSSIPCQEGSPWHRINKDRFPTIDDDRKDMKLRIQYKAFHQLFSAFKQLSLIHI